MRTINLCSRPGGCCPKLVIERGKTLTFTLVDDNGKEIKLVEHEAHNLALSILAEVGK